MGLFPSSSRFWFVGGLCSERESRSSFFNRAAGVKKVVRPHGRGLAARGGNARQSAGLYLDLHRGDHRTVYSPILCDKLSMPSPHMASEDLPI